MSQLQKPVGGGSAQKFGEGGNSDALKSARERAKEVLAEAEAEKAAAHERYKARLADMAKRTRTRDQPHGGSRGGCWC